MLEVLVGAVASAAAKTNINRLVIVIKTLKEK